MYFINNTAVKIRPRMTTSISGEHKNTWMLFDKGIFETKKKQRKRIKINQLFLSLLTYVDKKKLGFLAPE